MSHSMHRSVSPDRDDYVIHIRSTKGVNRAGALDKLYRIMDALQPLRPAAFGNPGDGCTLRASAESVLAHFTEGSNLHVTFGDAGAFKEALRVLRDLDTGLSVCVAAPLEQVLALSEELGLEPDSVLLDLGVMGAELATPQDVLDVVSLCGHMRISPRLVADCAEKVRAGKMTAEKAAQDIGRACRCGCFNTAAAAGVLKGE